MALRVIAKAWYSARPEMTIKAIKNIAHKVAIHFVDSHLLRVFCAGVLLVSLIRKRLTKNKQFVKAGYKKRPEPENDAKRALA